MAPILCEHDNMMCMYCPENGNYDFNFCLLQSSYTCTGAGVPHIAEHILSSLDPKSVTVSEHVSTLWRDVIDDLSIWKYLVKESVKNKPLWKELFQIRGW